MNRTEMVVKESQFKSLLTVVEKEVLNMDSLVNEDYFMDKEDRKYIFDLLVMGVEVSTRVNINTNELFPEFTSKIIFPEEMSMDFSYWDDKRLLMSTDEEVGNYTWDINMEEFITDSLDGQFKYVLCNRIHTADLYLVIFSNEEYQEVINTGNENMGEE